jgi:hypothetical protein
MHHFYDGSVRDLSSFYGALPKKYFLVFLIPKFSKKNLPMHIHERRFCGIHSLPLQIYPSTSQKVLQFSVVINVIRGVLKNSIILKLLYEIPIKYMNFGFTIIINMEFWLWTFPLRIIM